MIGSEEKMSYKCVLAKERTGFKKEVKSSKHQQSIHRKGDRLMEIYIHTQQGSQSIFK
jgi:hypothetical protein